MYIISNPHNNPLRKIVFCFSISAPLPQFCINEDSGGPGKLSNFPKTTQLISGLGLSWASPVALFPAASREQAPL